MNTAATLPFYSPLPDELDATRGVEFIEMPVRQILNRCDSPRMPFRWTINPYRGCEFGCVYCYARYTHDFLELRDPMDFERKIFVKRMAAEVLSRTLSRTPIGADALDARSFRAARGTGPLDHDQVEPDRSRPRAAAKDKSALEVVGELLADNPRSK